MQFDDISCVEFEEIEKEILREEKDLKIEAFEFAIPGFLN